MLAKTVVHVGPHKTGSTALQAALQSFGDHDESSEARYLTIGRPGNSHTELVEGARGRLGLDGDAILEEAKRAPVAIISCENIVLLKRTEMERLRDALPRDRPIEIVYYLRRLVDLWPSHWQELVKHGLDMSITDYVAYNLLIQPYPRTSRINQHEQLQLLHDVFGKDVVRVFGYDALNATEGGIIKHFFDEILQVEAPSSLDHRRVLNVSELYWRIELIRFLNAIHSARGGRPTPAIRVSANRALDEERVCFAKTFQNIVEELSIDVDIPVNDIVVNLQRKTLDLAFQKNRAIDDALVNSYMDSHSRSAKMFCLPVVGYGSLIEDFVRFYDDIISYL